MTSKNSTCISFARSIRYNDRFKEKGTNVNIVNETSEGIEVRTYERGVEDETLSCGTGVTACALAYALNKNKLNGDQSVNIHTQGGKLNVSFNTNEDVFNEYKIIRTGCYGL